MQRDCPGAQPIRRKAAATLLSPPLTPSRRRRGCALSEPFGGLCLHLAGVVENRSDVVLGRGGGHVFSPLSSRWHLTNSGGLLEQDAVGLGALRGELVHWVPMVTLGPAVSNPAALLHPAGWSGDLIQPDGTVGFCRRSVGIPATGRLVLQRRIAKYGA